MKTRSPKTDPQPGDAVSYKNWTIRVVARWPGVVEYVANKPGAEQRTGRHDLSKWKGWAKDAKVVDIASSDGECVTTAYVAGRCSVDNEPIVGPAHCVGLTVTCEAHCKGVHKKEKKRRAA